jgi:cytochrome c553
MRNESNRHPLRALALASFLLPSMGFASSAPELWLKAKCALCHAKDGSGKTETGEKLKVRDLRSDEIQKLTDEQFTKSIAGGHKRMPGFKSQLAAADVRLLITHIRAFAKPAEK